MKKVLSSVIVMVFVAGLFLFGGNSVQAADMKIATIDVESLFNEYYKTKENDEMLKNEGQQKADERREMVEQIKKMKADSELLSESARKEKEMEIDAKIKKLQAFDQSAKTELREKRDDFLKVIFDDIKVAVEDKAKKEGYTLVINDKALLYKSDSLDITDQVLAEINKGHETTE